jgi:hypothetical protein
MGHDYHFAFSLPGSNYPRPYYRYAGKRWEEFGDTEKILTTKHTCVSCGQEDITGCPIRERPEKPLEYDPKGKDDDVQHRYIFVYYCADYQFAPHLSVTPQLMDAFHAYPMIDPQPYLNTDHEWDCRLIGYGLADRRMRKSVYAVTS